MLSQQPHAPEFTSPCMHSSAGRISIGRIVCLLGGKLSLAGTATSIIFFATTQNTSFVATKVCLLQQNHVCRDVLFFFAPKLCLLCHDKHNFIILFRFFFFFCHDKHTFGTIRMVQKYYYYSHSFCFVFGFLVLVAQLTLSHLEF